jgi:hypothetical protein
MGFGLHQSRRDGTWHVTDSHTRALIFPTGVQSDGTYRATFEEVEEYLAEQRFRRM